MGLLKFPPNNLTTPTSNLILCSFTFMKLTTVSVYSPNNSSNNLYHCFAHQVLASRAPATLSARIGKANLRS